MHKTSNICFQVTVGSHVLACNLWGIKHTYRYVCIYIYLYIHMSACVCVCAYVCISVCTLHRRENWWTRQFLVQSDVSISHHSLSFSRTQAQTHIAIFLCAKICSFVCLSLRYFIHFIYIFIYVLFMHLSLYWFTYLSYFFICKPCNRNTT